MHKQTASNNNITGYPARVKEELKDYLESYMDAQQIEYKGEGRGSFKCPNYSAHANGDRTHSGSFRPNSNGKGWRCHRCGEGGDIFEMAHFVEGLPKGNVKEFWSVTVPMVAESVGYPIKEEEYFKDLKNEVGADKDKFRVDMKKMMETIRKRQDPKRISPEFGRNYPDDIKEKVSEEFQVFFPVNGDMKFLSKGHPLKDPKIIKTGHMVLPLHNRYGVLSGFIARKTMEEAKKHPPKYLYTSSMDQKEKLNIFNIHRARKFVAASGCVYIFEAQYDCVTAFVHGLRNSISTGVAPDPGYLMTLIREMGAKEVVIILDRDKAGVESTVNLYEKLTDDGFVVSVFQLPQDMDADEYITENGISSIEDPAKRVSIIQYILDNDYGYLSQSELSPASRYIYALEYVVKFSRTLAMAATHIDAMAEKFDIKTPSDIHFDIQKEMANRKDPLTVRCNDLVKDKMREILDEPDLESKVSQLDRTVEEVHQLYSTYLVGSLSQEIHELGDLLSQGDESDRGRVLSGIEDLDSVIRLYEGTLAIIGGRPSAGKSTLMRALVPAMLRSNEELFILHLSLDDTIRDTMDGIISNLSGIPNEILESNQIRANQMDRLADAQETIKGWWNKRFYLCGQEKVSTMDDVRNAVRRAEILAPGTKIVLIIDNLMNLSQIAGAHPRDKRIKVEMGINDLHVLTQSKGLITFCIVELTKGGPYRPTLDMLKETGTLEYRAKMVGLLHNDLKSDPESKINWRERASEDLWPVLEVEFPKYKMGSPNRRIFLPMNPAVNRFQQANEEQIRRWKKLIATNDNTRKGPRTGGRKEEQDEF